MHLLPDLWSIILCQYLPYWENVKLLESKDTFKLWYSTKELDLIRKRWVKRQTVKHLYKLEKFGYGMLVFLDEKLHNEHGPAKVLRHIDRTNQYGENHTLRWCDSQGIRQSFFVPRVVWFCANKRSLLFERKEDITVDPSISNDLNSKEEYYIGGLRHRKGGPAVLFVAKPGGVLDGLKEKDDEYWENGFYQPYFKDLVVLIFVGLIFGIIKELLSFLVHRGKNKK